MSTLSERPTPYLAVDLDRLDANLARTAALARAAGAALRPHAKTHKSVRIGRRQLAAGAVGLSVATVAEAEVFAAGGCDDLVVAYPLWVDAARGARLRDLPARVVVGIDSAEGARQLARYVPGARVRVEVDSGHHRSGVPPHDAGAVAVAAARSGLVVEGVFTFPGHAYGPGDAAALGAADERTALAAARGAVVAAGLECPVTSGGSTPSLGHAAPGGPDELRPGVSALWDAQQVELGHCSFGEVALHAVGTVVSRRGDRVVVDAGSKVLGADRAGWATGHGRVLDAPDARVVALSEHHATVTWPGSAPALGERVRLIPNHVCNAVNLVDELVVVRAGDGVDVWPVDARGANT